MTVQPSDLERSFDDFVGRNGLLPPSGRVVAAVSGGVDSMVMLTLLERLRRTVPFDLSVAHVNHRLRGPESDRDEDLVRETAAALGLAVHVHRSADPGNGPTVDPGIQERAREERYRFFDRLRSAAPGTRVATGHHRDDNAETVLFNFLRGSGVHGLSGIPVARRDGSIIRPLLFATRAAILEYAAAAGVRWRDDASNATPKYTRNAIRHSVIPAIESAVNPGVRETMARTALLFTDLQAYVTAEVDRVMPGLLLPGEGLRLDVAKLSALPLFLRESVIHAAARRFIPCNIGFVHVRTILRLIDAATGSSCLVLRGLHAARERDCLVLSEGPPPGKPFDFPVAEGESYVFERFSFSSGPPGAVTPGASRFEEYVDADRLRGDLRLRNWQDGDWFVPFGMGTRKKLSDFFVDRKVPLAEKRRIPILVSGDDVVWVCGERLDDRFRLTPGTKRILLLRYLPAGEGPAASSPE
jgi:tRNA(Ile)-lysidine synthase